MASASGHGGFVAVSLQRGLGMGRLAQGHGFLCRGHFDLVGSRRHDSAADQGTENARRLLCAVSRSERQRASMGEALRCARHLPSAQLPLGGVENGGFRMVYTDASNIFTEPWGPEGGLNAYGSLGMYLTGDGT